MKNAINEKAREQAQQRHGRTLVDACTYKHTDTHTRCKVLISLTSMNAGGKGSPHLSQDLYTSTLSEHTEKGKTYEKTPNADYVMQLSVGCLP